MKIPPRVNLSPPATPCRVIPYFWSPTYESQQTSAVGCKENGFCVSTNEVNLMLDVKP